MSQQDAAQLRVIAAAHALHGDARSSVLYVAKLNAAGGIKANAIGERNLRRNFPKTGSNRLVVWSLCYHVKRVARRNPHTAFSVKDDVYHKRFAAEVGVSNIIHARSLQLLPSRRPLPTEAFGAWPGLVNCFKVTFRFVSPQGQELSDASKEVVVT
ncbi:MAG: hypothetical protein WCJ76_02145 [Comamonadaceae bacterium]